MSFNKRLRYRALSYIFPLGSCLDFAIAIPVSIPNGCMDALKAVIAAFSRVSLAAITSGQGDIDHLPHRDEVQTVFSLVARPFHQFLKETLNRRPKHC